jgi:hypothetical protein
MFVDSASQRLVWAICDWLMSGVTAAEANPTEGDILGAWPSVILDNADVDEDAVTDPLDRARS